MRPAAQRGHGPLTRQERHTLTERGQGLGSQPLPPEDRTRPFGPLALGRGRGEWGRRQDNISADLVTGKPRRRLLQSVRLSPRAETRHKRLKAAQQCPTVGPCRENAPTAAQRAPAAGFCPDPPASTGRPSFLQTLLAAVDLPTSHPGAVSTETRLRRRPASGLRPICPGLSARRGPLAAGRPGLPGRAA